MWQFESDPDNWLSLQSGLHRWYATPTGESMLTMVEKKLDAFLPQMFGYQGVQIGQPLPGANLIQGASLLRTLVMDADCSPVGVDIHGEPHRLPLANDSMQMALLMHTLDFTQQPHQVLRELDRVLVADGFVVVVGFNPYSRLGLRRLLSLRSAMPWSGHFYSRLRVSDWLSLLSYRELKVPMSLPNASTSPLSTEPSSALLPSLRFVRQRLQHAAGEVAPVYVLVAQKQSIPLNPSLGQLLRPRRANVIHAVFAGTERGVKRSKSDSEPDTQSRSPS